MIEDVDGQFEPIDGGFRVSRGINASGDEEVVTCVNENRQNFDFG
jgi:hypothetical protein